MKKLILGIGCICFFIFCSVFITDSAAKEVPNTNVIALKSLLTLPGIDDEELIALSEIIEEGLEDPNATICIFETILDAVRTINGCPKDDTMCVLEGLLSFVSEIISCVPEQ